MRWRLSQPSRPETWFVTAHLDLPKLALSRLQLRSPRLHISHNTLASSTSSSLFCSPCRLKRTSAPIEQTPIVPRTMSAQAPAFSTPPSDANTPSQDRGIFHREAQKHQCHHYVSHSRNTRCQAACSPWAVPGSTGFATVASLLDPCTNEKVLTTTPQLRMYGGQVLNAAMWGFGATMGADAANAAFGEAKVGRYATETVAVASSGMVEPYADRKCQGMVAALIMCATNSSGVDECTVDRVPLRCLHCETAEDDMDGLSGAFRSLSLGQ